MKLGLAAVPVLLCVSGLSAGSSCVTAVVSTPLTPAADPARDRATILAMQGEYRVDFAFDETVLLQPGYRRAPALRSRGNEVVIVIEDSPERIVLQHLLVGANDGQVIKHWRQDWSYQARQRFEYSAEQTWSVRSLPDAQTERAWTQCVYEVSDAPRYCGTGRWEYATGQPTWTSDRVWRPLPRREYSRRSDYNVLAAVNRHTLTPGGWSHEQFNTKIRRAADGGEEAIAREVGFNDYVSNQQFDSAPAYAYWRATGNYWAKVRARWAGLLRPLTDGDGTAGIHLRSGRDGMAMIVPMFTQAESLQAGRSVDDAQIDALFARWVQRVSVPASR